MARKIIFFEEHFIEFYKTLDNKVKEKVKYVFELIKQVERVPEKFLAPIKGYEGLFEIRIEFQSNIPEILDPVKIENDKERLASPDLLEFITYAKAESPIKKWTLTIIQAGRQLRYFEGSGEPQPKQWIIRPNELAASNVPIDYRFFALAEDGSQKEVS